MVAYGLLLPPAALAIPRLGCFNVHASLLPRWRGAAPIQRAILAGDATTGVTIMRMEAGLDTGPTLAARAIEISAARHGRQLARSACRSRRRASLSNARCAGARSGFGSAAAASRHHLCGEDQQERGADRLARGRGAGTARIRAYNPAPVAETRLDGAQLRIWEAEPAAPQSARVGCCAGNGAARRSFAASWWRAVGVSCASFACSSPAASRWPLGTSSQARPLAGARFATLMNTAAAGARSLAAHAVARVLREGVTLDAALHDALCAAPATLVPAVRSLSYGAVRGYYRHEAMLGRLLSQPVRSLDFLVRALLSVALFELEDARTPEYAVVDAAVKTAKATDAARAGGLINAVLRRYLARAQNARCRDRAQPRGASRLAGMARRPAARRLAGALDAVAGGGRAPSADVAARGRAANDGGGVRGTPSRGGPRRTRGSRVYRDALALDRAMRRARVAGVCARASFPCRISGRSALPFRSASRRGSGCSMPARRRAARPRSSPSASRSSPSWSPSTSTPNGLMRVRENLQRGELHAKIVCADAALPETWWDGVPFDRILLDAPCSALGVIRRHPDIRLRKSPVGNRSNYRCFKRACWPPPGACLPAADAWYTPPAR